MTKFSRFSNTDIDALISGFLRGDGVSVFTDGNFAVFPGFCDVHVHLREPGFSYKETIKTGTLAAAHGGYTDVCAMPNLSPVPDSVKSLEPELDAIKRDAVVRVHPYGSITKGELGNELSDMAELAPYVCALSDDGKGVASGDIMQSAMLTAKSAGKIIAAHCEDMSFVNGGYIRDCVYARANGHRTIQPESEYMQVERDLKLAEKTGVAYHICHISTKESVDLVRQAKKRGIDVTCETAPHYLVLTTDALRDDGCFRMNMNEVATATRYNIPVIEIIFNNHVLGMVRQWQDLFYGKRYSATVLDDCVDFVKVSEGMGAKGYRVQTIEEFEAALKDAMALNIPCVIDCLIDREDKVFPMVSPGAAISEAFDRKDLDRMNSEK